MRTLLLLLGFTALPLSTSFSLSFPPSHHSSKLADQSKKPDKRAPYAYAPPTWDNTSLFLLGQRALLYGGEFHPFRLPVPSLWWDVLEKMKAAGLNTVSFYVPWALLEGKPGEFLAEGLFDLSDFFEAADALGLWLVARPGPYINAEVTGGGLPGWLQRLRGHPRTADVDYLASTDNYAANIAAIIAKAQIINGGRVILYQPENEYSLSRTLIGFNFPDPGYMEYVENQARDAGVVVPFINNDAWSAGHNAPGTGVGQVDVYGHDLYPLDFVCSNSSWEEGSLRDQLYFNHLNISPSTPFALPEFQGGVIQYWGDEGFAKCADKFNVDHTRVYYKNNIGAGAKIINIYMMYGGTNWGNLGYDAGYTSYDYAAAIAEDRTLTREKYSELKLQAHFLKVSPGYLEATPDIKPTTNVYSMSPGITVTAVSGPKGSFYVTRRTAYQDPSPVNYTLMLPTSKGLLTIPNLGGTLTMPGRDTRIHVTDYPVGTMTLVYCTAEIFTWQKLENRTVAVLYGAMDETHEFLLLRDQSSTLSGNSPGVKTAQDGSYLYVQWKTTQSRQFVRVGDLYFYLIDRNSAYNYWVPDTPNEPPLIINGGYLIRSAALSGGVLTIRGDFNRTTTPLEIIGAPSSATSLVINTFPLAYLPDADGNWHAQLTAPPPPSRLPTTTPLNLLTTLTWSSLNSLPELSPTYSDAAWPLANHTFTNNTYTQAAPLTPTSLFASDYTFHAGGALLFRGTFTATGAETVFWVTTQGGRAFASAVWANDTFLGSWPGNSTAARRGPERYPVRFTPGATYVLTVLVDNMGNAQNALVGGDGMKAPRGVLEYGFVMGGPGGGDAPRVAWKVTGNLGGESYRDRARGPLNEGGLWAERQGYHLPGPPVEDGGVFGKGSPGDGIGEPGVGFWTAELVLGIPGALWDVPLSFEFPAIDPTGASGRYRAVLWVNGFHFGRYISHIGPQTSFPVPEGILHYNGSNTIAVALWALQPGGARLSSLGLRAGTPVLTGRRPVVAVPAPAWTLRAGAY